MATIAAIGNRREKRINFAVSNSQIKIFFGLLYTALTIVGTCVGIAVFKTVLQVFGFVRDRHF